MPSGTKKRPRKRTPMAYKKAFGNRMKMARNARHLSQESMATALGVKTDTYIKYENGARAFPMDMVERLVRITGWSAWHLVTGLPDDEDPVSKGVETGSFVRPWQD